MSHYLAILKKEILENLRTHKVLILLLVFFIFGVMNPLTAVFTPEILKTFMPEGMSITIPDPVALDSWAQFFSNVTQLGLIIVVILFSGILGNEFSKGTLINLITKGLSRTAVILAKFSSMVLLWTVSIALCFLVTWGYTIYLFPGDTVTNLFPAVLLLWLFGVFLLALLLFTATLVKANYGCLLITGAVVVVGMLLGILPDAYKYNPMSLASRNMGLLSGETTLASLAPAIWITAGLILVWLVSSVLVFRKKEL